MLKTNSYFSALKTLQTNLHNAETFSALEEALALFSQDQSLPISFHLRSAVEQARNSSDVASFPIPHSPYTLDVTYESPLDENDRALLRMVVSFLASSPAMHASKEGSEASQQALLRRVSNAIANQQRFDKVVRLVAEAFEAAFPHLTGCLLLRHKDDRFEIEKVFGDVQAEQWQESILPDTLSQRAVTSGDLQGSGTSYLVFPVWERDQVAAILQIRHRRGEGIGAAETAVLESLARYISISLSHRAMSQQSWQRASQLETIYRITESVRILRPLEPTLVAIHKQLLAAFAPPTCYIALCDDEAGKITFPCVWEQGVAASREPIPLVDERSLVGWVIANKIPYATDDWQSDASRPVAGISSTGAARSVMCVPMRVGEEVLGAISIQSDEPDAFDASDFQTLTAVASHVAVIIKNARLFTATRRLVDKGARDYQTAVALRQAIAAISASLNQEEVIGQLLLALGKVVTYRIASAFIFEEDRLVRVAARHFRGRPIRVSAAIAAETWSENALVREIVRTRQPVRLRHAQQDGRWPSFAGGEQVESWLGTPIMAGGVLLGILMVDSEKADAFNERQEWLVSSLAAHAGVAVQNAQLYQQTQQQLAELSTLYQASATMTANLDQDFVLQSVASEMVRALDADSCTIFVLDEESRRLRSVAHISRASQEENDHTMPGIGLKKVEKLETLPPIRRVFESREIVSLRADKTLSADEAQLLQASDLESLFLVPLVRRDKVLGLLALGQLNQPRSYSQSQYRLAHNLAGQAAVAIEHARLFSQAKRRINELSTFHEIVLQLNTPLKLNAVLDTITESALKLTDATNLHIYLYDAETKEFTEGSALWRDGRRTAAVKKPRAAGDGLTASVVQKGEPIVINDAASHRFFQSPQAKAWGIHAIAGFPLKHRDEVLGAFTATYLHPHTFMDEELLLLNLLAEQAVVAVKNAALFAESQRRLRDMSALVDMAKQVTGNLKLQSVLQTTVQILRQLLNARASTITMLSDDGQELIVKAADGVNPEFINARMRLDDSVSGQVVQTSQLVYTRDAHKDPNFLFFDEVVRSLLVVPLIVRDKPIGTLTVDSAEPNTFSESDIQLMTIAAAQVSVAITNAHLFEELEARAMELKVAYDELKESDRLKDELVQNVSHELRTPLTFVKGYVDLLMDGEMGLLESTQMDALQIISEKTNDITRIIEDIITLQRIDAGNLKTEIASMAEIIKTTVSAHRLVASQKGLTIQCDMSNTEKGLVRVDKGRINQVVDNLIGNAMKFSPDGGTITVSMRVRDDTVLVVIADEGIGMPPEQHERIFDRFYQIDGSSRRRFGGTGIGLAIVKRVIDAHKGKIWVESELNQGSAFYFTLPRVKENVSEVIA